jgi:putative flippase GtrA
VYAITAGFGLKYGFSKIITAVLVGVLFNFPLHRHYVFK